MLKQYCYTVFCECTCAYDSIVTFLLFSFSFNDSSSYVDVVCRVCGVCVYAFVSY